jgi:hypothetical protein
VDPLHEERRVSDMDRNVIVLRTAAITLFGPPVGSHPTLIF